jgi:hypothetical protein
MDGLTFREFVVMREKAMPPFAVPVTRINPLPVTQGRLNRTAPKPVQAPIEPFPPTVRPVAEIVPSKLVRKGRVM